MISATESSDNLERRCATNAAHQRRRLTAIEPFSPPFSSSAWEDLRARLKRTRWPDEIPDSSWGNGFDLEFLKGLCRYWIEDFDWQAQINRLSLFPHYRFTANEGKIHFLHVKGKGPAPIPLV